MAAQDVPLFVVGVLMDFDPWPDRDLGLSRSYQFSIKRSGAGAEVWMVVDFLHGLAS